MQERILHWGITGEAWEPNSGQDFAEDMCAQKLSKDSQGIDYSTKHLAGGVANPNLQPKYFREK